MACIGDAAWLPNSSKQQRRLKLERIEHPGGKTCTRVLDDAGHRARAGETRTDPGIVILAGAGVRTLKTASGMPKLAYR